MAVDILMPGVGAGTTHGKIIQWLRQVGDAVTVGDIVAEIETDKAVIELEVFDDGVLSEILVDAGDQEVAVGERLAVIETATGAQLAAGGAAGSMRRQEVESPADQAPPDRSGDAAPVTARAASAGGAPQPAARAAPQPVDRVFASPSARRLARELDVDLASLEGSGPKGRIVRVDIERANAASPAAHPVSARPPEAPAETIPTPQAETVPHSSVRKTIARRLQESKQEIPHFYLTIDIEMKRLMKLRKRLNTLLEESGESLRLSLNDMLAYSAGAAVAQCPNINVRWTADALEKHSQVDISIAVATPKGLITPVVRDVARKKLSDVARELHALIERARAGRIAPPEYEGGSITLSNLGMYGVREFSAIINPPQAAILALGAVEQRPLVKHGKVKVADIMTVTLSADHRAIDGELGARFLARFKQLVERPVLSLF